jgi:hypothetical protein
MAKKTDIDLLALASWQWDDDGDDLDVLVAKIAKKKPTRALMDALLHVFERHPDIDDEDLKVIVHALEEMPGYEKSLIASMGRLPSCYGVRMVNRILNSKKPKAEKADWIQVLQKALDHPKITDDVRAEIVDYLEHHGIAPRPEKKNKRKPKDTGVTGDDLASLLGKLPDGREVKAMEKRLGEKGRLTGRDSRGAFLRCTKAGIDFWFPKKGALQNLFMPHDRTKPAALHVPLPKGLQLQMPRKQVHALLGKPDHMQPVRGTALLTFPATDTYDLPEYSLCVEYSAENLLVAVQLCAEPANG